MERCQGESPRPETLDSMRHYPSRRHPESIASARAHCRRFGSGTPDCSCESQARCASCTLANARLHATGACRVQSRIARRWRGGWRASVPSRAGRGARTVRPAVERRATVSNQLARSDRRASCRDSCRSPSEEKVMRCWIALIVALIASSNPVGAETSVRIGVGSPSLQFDFLYSDYGADRRVVEREVAVLGEADFLVALHLCRAADVELDAVIGWRRSGLSWDTITRRCRRDATIYYIEVPVGVSGPPYGRAHGHWKKTPTPRPRAPRLGDPRVRSGPIARQPLWNAPRRSGADARPGR